MVFSSIPFLFVFLPFALMLYYFLPTRKNSVRNLILALISTAFYVIGSSSHIFLLLGMAFANYIFGYTIAKARENEFPYTAALLTAAILANILLLVYYKYFSWGLDILKKLPALSMYLGSYQATEVVLPLGISFFTFHAISYLVDIHRKEIEPAKTMVDFFCYFLMFPHLIAGPIVRFAHIAEDMRHRVLNSNQFYYGLKRFLLGLAKKILIANQAALLADAVFSLSADHISTPLVWLGVTAYALQIYFDFSAYSDMAIGLAAMFGFKFHENFLHPYSAVSMQDFWRRWHISLSTWLRDYLYIPLGGNRGSQFATIRNLVIVFFICGLWHGANWTFVLWGLYHGVFLILERLWLGKVLRSTPALFGHCYATVVFLAGWAIFRANDLDQAVDFLSLMFLSWTSRPFPPEVLYILTPFLYIILAVGIIGSWGVPANVWKSISLKIRPAVCESLTMTYLSVTLLFSLMSLLASAYNPFIYFRF